MSYPLLIFSQSDTWSRLLMQIHILNDKHWRSRSVGFRTDLDLHYLQWQDIYIFNRTKVSKGNLFDFILLQLVLVPCSFTIVQIMFSFPLGSLGPLWYLWKWSSANVYTRGHKQCCKLHYCLFNVSCVSKGNLFDFYFTTMQLAVKHLPVLHHSADYIFVSFGITGPTVVSLKMEFCSCIR